MMLSFPGLTILNTSGNGRIFDRRLNWNKHILIVRSKVPVLLNSYSPSSVVILFLPKMKFLFTMLVFALLLFMLVLFWDLLVKLTTNTFTERLIKKRRKSRNSH